jgi:hypothetical protein
MAEISNIGPSTEEQFAERLRGLDDGHLTAQDLAQQGAIHAISFLLQSGCNEDTAAEMLASLRRNARLIREEARRRGKDDLFSQDQTGFQ